MTAVSTDANRASSFIPDLRVPVGWTLSALAAGLILGILLEGNDLAARVLPVADVVGTLWLRGLQMTIVPLVAALLVIGIVQTVAAASAGRVAATSLALFAAILINLSPCRISSKGSPLFTSSPAILSGSACMGPVIFKSKSLSPILALPDFSRCIQL